MTILITIPDQQISITRKISKTFLFSSNVATDTIELYEFKSSMDVVTDARIKDVGLFLLLVKNKVLKPENVEIEM